MNKPSGMASRYSFLVTRTRMPKTYLTIKKETYKVIVSFIYLPVHIRSGRIILFPDLRDVEEN